MDWTTSDTDGIATVEFCGHDWTGKILTGYGANLIDLRYKGVKLLRTPLSVEDMQEYPEAWGIPVLFPPNRLSGGRLPFRGREYRFPINDRTEKFFIHGVLVRRVWTIESAAENKIIMRYDHTPSCDSFAWLPHEFTARVSYEFTEDAVLQQFEVTNDSGETMPLAFGFHTAFNTAFAPKNTGSSSSDAPDDSQTTVRVTTADQRWLIKNLVPTGELVPFEEGRNWPDGIVPKGMTVSTLTPVKADADGFRCAVIENKPAGVRIVYEIDEKFSQWMLWNFEGDKAFFCPEPQTWITDAPNVNLPPEVSGVQALDPGAFWQVQNRIHVAVED